MEVLSNCVNLREREGDENMNPNLENILKLKDLSVEVALEVLAQYPEYTKMYVESLNHKNVIIKNKQENARQSFMFYQEILNDISKCLENNDLTFEQRLILIDKEIEVAKLVDQMVVEMNG